MNNINPYKYFVLINKVVFQVRIPSGHIILYVWPIVIGWFRGKEHMICVINIDITIMDTILVPGLFIQYQQLIGDLSLVYIMVGYITSLYYITCFVKLWLSRDKEALRCC